MASAAIAKTASAIMSGRDTLEASLSSNRHSTFNGALSKVNLRASFEIGNYL